MKELTKEEIDLIVTLLTRFIIKDSATLKEFETAQSAINKLSEN